MLDLSSLKNHFENNRLRFIPLIGFSVYFKHLQDYSLNYDHDCDQFYQYLLLLIYLILKIKYLLFYLLDSTVRDNYNFYENQSQNQP